jgi:hypothetical protein
MVRGTIVLVVALAWACTRENAAFEDGTGSEGDSGRDTSTGPGVTSNGTSAGPGPGTLDDGELTSVSATTSTSGLDSGSASESAEETANACMPSFKPPRGIDANPMLDFGECPAVMPLTLNVTNQRAMALDAHLCDRICPCPAEQEISLTFDVTLPMLLELPSCLELMLDLGLDCELRAYALSVLPFEGTLPLLIVSNVVNPEFPDPFEFMLHAVTDMPCGDGCNPPSGYYDLVTAEGDHVPPTGATVSVGLFDVVNEGSGRNEACEPEGRWYAHLQ